LMGPKHGISVAHGNTADTGITAAGNGVHSG
jgi:hypothetical protein